MERTPRDTKTFEIDLAVPVDRKIFRTEVSNEASCFGKLWDLGTKLCSQCADKDTCGIVYKDTVDKKAKDLEQSVGAKYLDATDFDNVNTDKLMQFIQSGVTTLDELVTEIMRLANTSDNVAAQEWLKRWHKEHRKIKSEKGVVWTL